MKTHNKPETYKFCLRCNRPLKSELSRSRGYGKVCYEREMNEPQIMPLFNYHQRREGAMTYQGVVRKFISDFEPQLKMVEWGLLENWEATKDLVWQDGKYVRIKGCDKGTREKYSITTITPIIKAYFLDGSVDVIHCDCYKGFDPEFDAELIEALKRYKAKHVLGK